MRLNRKTRYALYGLLLFFLIVFGFVRAFSDHGFHKKFPWVVDGDTIKLIYEGQEESIRMLRINAPERDQPGYLESKRALIGMVKGHELKLEFEIQGKVERDRYGRILAYVFAEGKNLNVEMVRLGWSKFWTRYGEGKYASEFRKAEAEARENKRGLWSSKYKHQGDTGRGTSEKNEQK